MMNLPLASRSINTRRQIVSGLVFWYGRLDLQTCPRHQMPHGLRGLTESKCCADAGMVNDDDKLRNARSIQHVSSDVWCRV